MRIPFQNAAQYGVMADVEPHDLPLLAWSSGKNVRFRNGKVEKMKGHGEIFTPAFDVNFALTVEAPAGYYWLYAGDANVAARGSSISNDITPASFTPAAGQKWTGGVLNGIAVLNHFGNVPLAWMTPDGSTDLVALPNWPSTWRARSVRPFKNFIVAIGVKKGTSDNPHLVLWSHPADPGSAPNSYDVTNATVDAGEVPLAETEGPFVDQMGLAGANILYKTDCAYLMRHIGGIDIMGFKQIDDAIGLIAPNAFCSFASRGAKHLVFGPGDVYVHDGTTSETILRGRMRDWIFRMLSDQYYKNSFVVHSVDTQEIFVCFPENGVQYPNLALVWDYRNNTTTIRDLPSIGFAAAGRIVETGSAGFVDTWDAASTSWDEDTAAWGNGEYVATNKRVAMFSRGGARKAYALDIGTTFAGDEYDAFFERIALPIVGQDIKGQPIANLDGRKIVTEVWPRISADVGTQLKVRLGTQENVDDPISWTDDMTYIVGVTEKLTPYVSGKIISIRFSVKSKTSFRFSGFDLEVIPGGR